MFIMVLWSEVSINSKTKNEKNKNDNQFINQL